MTTSKSESNRRNYIVFPLKIMSMKDDQWRDGRTLPSKNMYNFMCVCDNKEIREQHLPNLLKIIYSFEV